MEVAKKKEIAIKMTKYVLYLIMMIVLNSATLNGNLQPFGFAMFFALIWCNQNIFLVSITYFLSCIVFGLTEQILVCSVTTIVLFLFFYFLHYKFKKPLNIWLIVIYGFLCQVGFLYYTVNSVDGLYLSLAYVTVGLIFLLATLSFFQAIVKKKFRNFNLEECVCAGLFLAVFSLGLSNFEPFHIALVQIFAIFLLLMLKNVNKTAMFLAGITMGLGASLNTFYAGYLYLFCGLTIIICIYNDKNPVFLILSALLCDLFVGLYIQAFPIYHFQSLIATFLGCASYILLPKNCKETMISVIASSEKGTLVENVVNAQAKKMNRKILETAEIFGELENLFTSMSSGQMTQEEVISTITQELVQKSCQDCKDKNRCLRLTSNETMELLHDLVFIALQKGKLTLVDVESRLSSKCIRINTLLTQLNSLIAEFSKYQNSITKADTSRRVVAKSLGGVSSILQELASNVDNQIRLDSQLERNIQEELTYEGILCREILLYEKDKNVIINMLIKNENLFKSKLINIVSKVAKQKMIISSIETSTTPNFSTVIMKPQPKFDVTYGISCRTKSGSESSGDTHSFNRIDDDKFIFALCDGMGSGEKARLASELSIGIIENLYKAGFNSETIIDCTNNLLTMSATEVFSAIDIGVIDLKNGICDIIKIGAPVGYIKHDNSTEIIQAGALPLGILEELHPSTTKTALCHGDCVIFLSDGVLDAFEDETILQTFVNNFETKNPQTLADAILNEAVHLNRDAPNDDMTVFVVRTLNKI